MPRSDHDDLKSNRTGLWLDFSDDKVARAVYETARQAKREVQAMPSWKKGEPSPTGEGPVSEFEDMCTEEVAMFKAKNVEYRNGGEHLSNFLEVASDLGVTPLQVWAIFADKHWRAILNYVRTGQQGAEGIESRMLDMAVYAKLGRMLVRAGK